MLRKAKSPSIIGIVVAFMILGTMNGANPARAQQDGESRCGADGNVERYSEGTHSWWPSLETCRSASEPEDGLSRCGASGYVETYSRLLRSWQRSMYDKCGNNRPEDGITRCGADGYVERYSRSNERWDSSGKKCQ